MKIHSDLRLDAVWVGEHKTKFLIIVSRKLVGAKEVSVLIRMFCSLFLHVLAGSYMHEAS